MYQRGGGNRGSPGLPHLIRGGRCADVLSHLHVTASGLDSGYTESENLVNVTAGKLAQPNRAVIWCLSVSGQAITEQSIWIASRNRRRRCAIRQIDSSLFVVSRALGR